MADDDQLALAIKGDADALSALLERRGPALRRQLHGTIPRRFQSILSIDDILQQTYTDAFVAIGQFEPRGEGSFGAWLSTLAKRNLLDALKMLDAAKRGGDRRRVEAGSSDSSYVALYEMLGTVSQTPSGQAAKDEAVTALEEAIERLPPTYAKLVRMYDLEHKPVTEVAAELDRSPGAIYMLRARALKRLSELMGAASQYFTDAE